jgi:hypothetical protein
LRLFQSRGRQPHRTVLEGGGHQLGQQEWQARWLAMTNDVISALSVSSLAMPGEEPLKDWEDGS